MRSYTVNRWWDALIKTIIFLVIAHIVLLILGIFWGGNVGWFGLSMIWAHWSLGWMNWISAILMLAVVYFAIYGWFTHEA